MNAMNARRFFNSALRAMLVSMVVAHAAVATGVELVANGSFETNAGGGSASFTSWTVVRENATSDVAGNFYAQTGALSPITRFEVIAPPNGTFAAMTDQNGPGRTVIYQDVAVATAGPVWLNLRVQILNQVDDFVVAPTLDVSPSPNQQVRVDVMSTAAGLWDVGAGVLTNVFTSTPGTVLPGGYAPLSINLQPFAGQTVRIRIAEVDNLHGLVVGVDQVSVTSVPASTCAPVRPRLGGASCNLDVDGDGLLTATDALLAVRYLAGFRSNALIAGITFDTCATQTASAAIELALAALVAGPTPALDIDGDAKALASSDGLLLTRSLLGLRGTAATNGAPATSATRGGWTAMRSYLNSTCLTGVLE
jgi:hypothetical protein